jgi:deazaflavin-dependent oxidoreductase (nitroreductase family)
MNDTTPEPRKSDLGTDITLLGPEHVRRYQETDGEVGYLWNGVTAMLVTTKGRKSGEMRTIPIIFTQVNDAQIIIASKGGAPDHPAWYLNVAADPHVSVQIKGEVFAAAARTATGDERAALWAAAVAQWPAYDIYQSRTSRVIPVVVLERKV